MEEMARKKMGVVQTFKKVQTIQKVNFVIKIKKIIIEHNFKHI